MKKSSNIAATQLVSSSNFIFVFLSFVFYLIVAYKSSGFIHADEHYQLIEFANYKLGQLSADKLAWEFRANARPGLQPLICYCLFKLFGLVGITDGYTLAFLLRVITAFFSIFVITVFVNAYKESLDKPLRAWFAFFSYFLWFLPYIDVRFSAETWSGLWMMLALVAVRKYDLKPHAKQLIIIGLLFGISILFKYQAALFVAGYFLWLISFRKVGVSGFLLIIATVATVLAFGVLIDFWLYGKITLSSINYFSVNIVQDVASKFGTSPVHQYVIDILTVPGPFGI